MKFIRDEIHMLAANIEQHPEQWRTYTYRIEHRNNAIELGWAGAFIGAWVKVDNTVFETNIVERVRLRQATRAAVKQKKAQILLKALQEQEAAKIKLMQTALGAQPEQKAKMLPMHLGANVYVTHWEVHHQGGRREIYP